MFLNSFERIIIIEREAMTKFCYYQNEEAAVFIYHFFRRKFSHEMLDFTCLVTEPAIPFDVDLTNQHGRWLQTIQIGLHPGDHGVAGIGFDQGDILDKF